LLHCHGIAKATLESLKVLDLISTASHFKVPFSKFIL